MARALQLLPTASIPVNFSAAPISDHTRLGKVLRLPLRLLPRSGVVPILQGCLKGQRWVVGSAVHGRWLGSYEREKQCRVAAATQPGWTAFDIGANVGFYTLLFSRLVGASGKVVAFEPLPHNLAYLRRHLALNGVANVTVFEAAVADQQGWAGFDDLSGSTTARLAPLGRLRVQVVTIDDLVASGQLPVPDSMKIDIEGAEYRAQCCGLLRDLGYNLEPIDSATIDYASELVATF